MTVPMHQASDATADVDNEGEAEHEKLAENDVAVLKGLCNQFSRLSNPTLTIAPSLSKRP